MDPHQLSVRPFKHTLKPVCRQIHPTSENAKLFDICLFLLIAQKLSAIFHLAFYTGSSSRILLHDCQKLRVVAEIFPLKGANFLIGIFLKVHLTLAENRTWSAFVPLCRV